VTLAGVLVQSLAEVLGGIVLAELVNPGNPVMIGTVASVMDMKEAQIALGSIETGLLGACTAQIAHHLDIPCRASAGASDSKAPDAQAGYESALNILLVSLAGANLIQYSVGALDFTKTASYEMLIIGDEILGEVTHALHGVNVSRETIALDLISKVGPGGSYLGEKHTRQYLKTEHYMPALANRRSYEAWKAAGGRPIAEEARERAKRILREHQPEPLDKTVEHKIEKIIAEVTEETLYG
jgi:trimethylamine--corrinoid protein Co-methyltransferase